MERFDAQWRAVAERSLNKKVDKSNIGCWPFTGFTLPGRNGAPSYGKIKVAGEQWMAHRLAWVLANGRDVPEGMLVRHSCDNPPCCNPAHLLVGPHRENMLDMTHRGRSASRQAGKIGHARERGLGRWELRVYIGTDPLSRKKRYVTRTVNAAGPTEAGKALAALVTDLTESGAIGASGTFGELVEKWFDVRREGMTPAGRKETRRIIDSVLRPLAGVRLETLTGTGGTRMLDDFYAALRDRGGRCRRRPPCPTSPCPHGGGGPLAASTVHRVHGIIHAALEQAVTWDLCRRNPATNASPGDIDVTEVRPPDPDLVIRMFELARPEFGRFVALAAATGARRGELLGLWWDDIDTFNNVINFRFVISLGPDGPERVRKGRGKGNRKGRGRSVPVDPAVGALLSAQFEESAARAAKLGIVLQPGDASYVFPAFGRDGSKAVDDYGFDPWRPDSTSRQFAALRAAAGLTGVRLHDLRHFVVSRLLAAGVDLRTVQELVGHAPGSPTTMRVYAHASDPNKVAAAAVMAKLLELGPAEVP